MSWGTLQHDLNENLHFDAKFMNIMRFSYSDFKLNSSAYLTVLDDVIAPT